MAEPGGVVTTTLPAYSPAPCPALDAILADDQHSLPSSNGQPLPDGRVHPKRASVAPDVFVVVGVHEYFIYDPPGRRREARILALRLRGGRYVEMAAEPLPNGARGVRSETVDLDVYVNAQGNLRWFDPDAGRDLDNYAESSERALATVRDRNQAYARRDAATAERDALRARLADAEAALRGHQPQRAE